MFLYSHEKFHELFLGPKAPTLNLASQDSSVGIATGYGLDDQGVGDQVPEESRIFSSPRRLDRLWGPTQPPIQWVTGALPRG
jgi:hypothetical protein